MINYIGKFLLVIFDNKKASLGSEAFLLIGDDGTS